MTHQQLYTPSNRGLADFYTSTNPSFKNDRASYSIEPTEIESNRPNYTSKELFSGVNSDIPKSIWEGEVLQHQYKKWFGGAIQGEIKEGWLGGAVQGEMILDILEFLVMTSNIDITHPAISVGFNPIDNDRLINLIKYLPDNFSGTQLSEFILFFENFLNFELFNYKLDPNIPDAKVSILKKIELLYTLRDPNLIDSDLLQFFASYLGYDINYSRGDIFTADNDTEINNYLRETISSLPSWYKLKSTSSSLSMLMYMFGIVSEVYTIWTSDYEENWDKENPTYESDSINVNLPAGYYPTPHFNITINSILTPGDYLSNLTTIIPMIESIKPINTVFEGFRLSAEYDISTSHISVSPVILSRIDTVEDFITP